MAKKRHAKIKEEDVWVIVPAYNEGKNIGKVIDELKDYVSNVVVVDDGSKDDTYSVASRKKVIVLKHIVNLGKGGAVKTGCDFALKNGAKYIILIDSDGQHKPSDIPRFLKKLEYDDVVFVKPTATVNSRL